MKISAERTKVLVFEGKDTVSFKTAVNNTLIEQIINCQNLCGTI
jgi:hypothetical protein